MEEKKIIEDPAITTYDREELDLEVARTQIGDASDYQQTMEP
jgi:hypothetical protein